MDKILFLTRGELSRWENDLAQKLNALVSTGSLMQRNLFFVLGSFAEEVEFYRKLPQSRYWKERIYRDYPFPKWLGQITPLKYLKKFYKPPKAAYDYLQKEKPNLVICSTLMLMPQYADFDLAFAAKELKIPLIGIVPTLDSLTTKTKLQVMPDLIFCWNETHKQELIKYHEVKPEIIFKVGPYTHEAFLKINSPTRKDKFYSKWGLNPNNPFVTFISSSPSTVGDEIEAIYSLAEANKDYQFVVRPHPQRHGQYVQLKNVWIIPGTAEKLDDQTKFQLAYDTYFYSSAIFSINSSAMIDVLLMGKQVYSIKTQFPDIREGANHIKNLLPYLNVDGKLPEKTDIAEFFHITNELPTEKMKKIVQDFLKL